MSHDIFISYSRRDFAAVKPIKEELESHGFFCWMDLEGIESGSEEFTSKIVSAIDGAKVLLFFLSSSSQNSEWSLKELRYSKGKGKRIVLIRFNEDAMTDVFSFNFGGADIIDWRAAPQREKLLEDCGKWLQRKPAAIGSGTQTQSDTPEVPKNPRPSYARVVFLTVLLLAVLLFILLVLFVTFAPNTSRAIYSLLMQLFHR